MSDIVNRVASSPILSINMEEFYPQEERVLFDLKPYLFQELILREKDFRLTLKELDWSPYSGKWVAVTCTADAIVPTWAFMLVCTYLESQAKGYVVGGFENLEQHIAEITLAKIDLEDYKDRPVVIKGCSKFPIPLFAYGRLISLLQGQAKSLMFGEPCSTVPLYKKSKS
ncbi:DUF2480 family protein [Algoriphagus sp. A40]|uniref:DUF2480 family protein n=1 Tax=Algoriphagus sp. A40 TaxID=1945863 RepID=UPI0009858AB1|nr:DUF2480 family protein [Algoriphagus sp. A40]OOG78584.1 hypothetical protein B0E43_01460 [Algoriphagus sp. A40]